MELDNQIASGDSRIVKLLEDSMLSDTVCVDESGCGDTESKHPGTPQPEGMLTTSVSESQCSASVSAYEDALTEVSCTKTPVLPPRSRATPLRQSARKAAQSNGDCLHFVSTA